MQLPLLVDGGGIAFDGSGEVQPGTEEACNCGVVLCEELDDCWKTEDIWGVLMTESCNRGGTVIIDDDNRYLHHQLITSMKSCTFSWSLIISFGYF